ncbi:uncharacterized protein LOC142339793 isoform X2 [Convolutriloba macropyga]|uniref:uncharacterized protein LOC142339793 isoform X2 n=1 Tax=Convolutriloba macropyga TaxID=536237 RepID=UPI003F51E3A8
MSEESTKPRRRTRQRSQSGGGGSSSRRLRSFPVSTTSVKFDIPIEEMLSGLLRIPSKGNKHKINKYKQTVHQLQVAKTPTEEEAYNELMTSTVNSAVQVASSVVDPKGEHLPRTSVVGMRPKSGANQIPHLLPISSQLTPNQSSSRRRRMSTSDVPIMSEDSGRTSAHRQQPRLSLGSATFRINRQRSPSTPVKQSEGRKM